MLASYILAPINATDAFIFLVLAKQLYKFWKKTTVSFTNVVTQTAICPLSPLNVDVYGFECRIQPVNTTLKEGRRRGMLLIAWMPFPCCSSKVLQLFMT